MAKGKPPGKRPTSEREGRAVLNVQVVGIPWYKHEEYPEVLKIMEDRQSLPPDFESWLKKAIDLREHIKGQGIVAVEAYIDPAAFVGWCRARSLHVNSAARIEYANLIAAASYRQGKAQ